jgi:titin
MQTKNSRRIIEATAQGKNHRLQQGRCAQVEGLESRVLMSAVVAAVHATPVVPAAPSTLTATAASPSSVSLNWTDGDKLATSFVVLRGTDNVHFSQIATVASPSAVSYLDTTALSFHTYSYEVEEVDGATASIASSPASATTPLNTPAAPTAVATGPNSVQVTWAVNDTSATGYVLLRSRNGAAFSTVATLGKVTTYLDTTAASATQYTYQVQATNGNSASTASKGVVVTTPLIAPSALASTLNNGSVVLTWTANDAGAAGYYVLRSANTAAFVQIANVNNGTTTTFTDTGLPTGHTFVYKVEAYAGMITSAASATLTVNTPLIAPSGLGALAAGPNAIDLNWTDNDPNAQGYTVYRGTDGVHYTALTKLTGAGLNTYVDKTAVSGTTYDYEVSDYSGTITSSQTGTATATTPLTGPAALTATVLGPTSVKLAWPLGDPLATGYEILRSTDGVNFLPQSAVTGRTTLGYTDTTVSSASTYTYEVQAINANNASAVSKTAAVTTPLLAPTLLIPTLSGATVELAWTDNDPAAAGYLVLRSTDTKPFTQIANLASGTASSYTDTASLTGHAYAYEVQAYLGKNTSALTAPASITVPLVAPSGLTATANSPTSVTLTWVDNDLNAATYSILRSTDGKTFNAVGKVTGAAAVTYTDTAALAGQNYTYEIQAVNGTITSPMSAVALVTTPLATPTLLAASAVTTQAVTLTWTDKDPLASGFVILRSGDGQTFNQIAQISGAHTTYTDTSVNTATAYSYEVQAVNAGNQSAVTHPVAVAVPLVAPNTLTATVQGGVVQLAWTDVDPNAAGYYVLRGTAGKPYVQIASLPDTAAGYADTAAATGHTYLYEVQAFAGSITSAVSAPLTYAVPLNAPSNLAANSGATGVVLTWTDNDANALGCVVLRSTDATHFSTLTTLTGATAATYTDSKAAANTTYTYEIEAVAGTFVSAASSSASVTTPLAAPATLTATLTGSYATLAWVDKDPGATSYALLRSTDNVTFLPLTTLSSATANSYVDTTVLSGATYYYQVQATSASNQSAVSNTATISMPAGNTATGVSVAVRYGSELVVTAAGTSDSVSITESGPTLTILGDGQTFTDPAPADGLFVYTRGGNDSVVIDQSVSTPTTIDSIDNAKTVINTAGTHVSIWEDSTDTLIGTATVHSVASFAGGVSKALGASLPNPTDAGTTTKQSLPLFGSGPVPADVNQGDVGDCYFLSSLAAFTNHDPQVIENAVVDLGDGTYAVEFQSKGNPVYVRVNNSFSSGSLGGFLYAHPGANDTIWAPVMEKAFAYFRTGANSYESIGGGAMSEVYTDLGIGSNGITVSSLSDASLYALLSNGLSNNEAITFGTQNAPNLVSDHAYALLGVSKVNGVDMYTVRNPWGVSGDKLENSAGIATLTYSQFEANFVFGTIATS